ncbi:VOC family protein [Paenarthrobacter aurescens]|uniref:VOC family protein n=1 Tax=Paenarthrobacter aurescens TaxID=43663 RepID=UPI0035EA0220
MNASVVGYKLVVSDVERSLNFYGSLFGFTQTLRAEFTGPDVTEVLLSDANGNRAFALISGDVQPVPSPKWVPMALQVDNLAPFHKAILEGGHELVVEPTSLGPVEILMVADPDGYLIEVICGDMDNLDGFPVGVKIPHPSPEIQDWLSRR